MCTCMCVCFIYVYISRESTCLSSNARERRRDRKRRTSPRSAATITASAYIWHVRIYIIQSIIYRCICMCVYIYTYLSIYLYLSIYIYIYIYIYTISIHNDIYLSISIYRNERLLNQWGAWAAARAQTSHESAQRRHHHFQRIYIICSHIDTILYTHTHTHIYRGSTLSSVAVRFWPVLPGPALGLYKIFVHSKDFAHESILLYCPLLTRIANNIAIVLHDHCAIYARHRPSLLMPYTITILVMAISCKGQAGILCVDAAWRSAAVCCV